jgi:hypothetical protein
MSGGGFLTRRAHVSVVSAGAAKAKAQTLALTTLVAMEMLKVTCFFVFKT